MGALKTTLDFYNSKINECHNIVDVKKGNLYLMKILDDIKSKVADENMDYIIVVEVKDWFEVKNEPAFVFEDLVMLKCPGAKEDNDANWNLELEPLTEDQQNCYLMYDLGPKEDHPELYL